METNIIKSTAEPDHTFKVFALISTRRLINEKYFTVMEDCENNFDTDRLPIIPAGTVIQADFGGDFGLYAVASVAGVLHKVQFDITEVQKINFGEIPDNLLEIIDAIKTQDRQEQQDSPDWMEPE